MLWFSVTLNENYQVKCSYPVSFINVPEDIQITQEGIPILNAIVEGTGLDVLIGKFQNRSDTIYLPFKTSGNIGYINTSDGIREIDAKFPPAVQIKSISPDTFTVSYAKKISKRIPLILQAKINLAPEYQLDMEPLLIPDSVVIIGPQTILDTTEKWYTMNLRTNVVSETVQYLSIPIIDTFPEIKIIPESARLSIRSQRYTQKNLQIPVQVKNVPQSTEVVLERSYINIICLVPLDKYEKVSSEDYDIEVDYETIDTSIPFLIPNIDFLPDFVKIVSISPAQIAYVIVGNNIINS